MVPLHVLIVDDNDVVRRLVGLIVEDAGHVPVEAESGEIALALAHVEPPDVVLVDDAMPGMSGLELVSALRGSPDLRLASVPIVGMSGRPGARLQLFGAGADAFVAKPVEEDALLAALAAVVHAPRPGGGAPPGSLCA